MGKLFRALLDKIGIRRFFSGVVVELPLYFLPNFKLMESPARTDVQRCKTSRAR